jgi:hypothetical protein
MLTKVAVSILLGGLAMSHFNEARSNQSGLQELINTVRADASRRSGLGEKALRVAIAEAVTWNDGSLGCGATGQSYTQALVPGYRIRIEGNGKTYEYHANERGSWKLCPTGLVPEAGGPLRK